MVSKAAEPSHDALPIGNQTLFHWHLYEKQPHSALLGLKGAINNPNFGQMSSMNAFSDENQLACVTFAYSTALKTSIGSDGILPFSGIAHKQKLEQCPLKHEPQ